MKDDTIFIAFSVTWNNPMVTVNSMYKNIAINRRVRTEQCKQFQQLIRYSAIDALNTEKMKVTLSKKDEYDIIITMETKTKQHFDIDNIAKPILDALEGVLINNDNQVTRLMLEKRIDDSLSTKEKIIILKVYIYD